MDYNEFGRGILEFNLSSSCPGREWRVVERTGRRRLLQTCGRMPRCLDLKPPNFFVVPNRDLLDGSQTVEQGIMARLAACPTLLHRPESPKGITKNGEGAAQDLVVHSIALYENSGRDWKNGGASGFTGAPAFHAARRIFSASPARYCNSFPRVRPRRPAPGSFPGIGP